MSILPSVNAKPRSTNEMPSIPAKNVARASQEAQAREQEKTQTPTSDPLSPYRALADELTRQVAQLSLLHDQRRSFDQKADALKAERTPLEARILDGAQSGDVLKELRLIDDQVSLNAARISAIGPRILQAEQALHTILPLSIDCFSRLRGFVIESELESARQKIRDLLEPGVAVATEHVDALAIAVPGFVAASRITLPPISFAWSKPLDPQPGWSSLVRPFTPQEIESQRRETVDALIAAAKLLCEAGRRLCAAAAPHAQGDIPEFKCEAEMVAPAVVDPKFLEWQLPLGGSDGDFVREVCKQSGRDPDNLSDRDKEILAGMLEQRHAHPVSHGIVTGEMVGSTYKE